MRFIHLTWCNCKMSTYVSSRISEAGVELHRTSMRHVNNGKTVQKTRVEEGEHRTFSPRVEEINEFLATTVEHLLAHHGVDKVKFNIMSSMKDRR